MHGCSLVSTCACTYQSEKVALAQVRKLRASPAAGPACSHLLVPIFWDDKDECCVAHLMRECARLRKAWAPRRENVCQVPCYPMESKTSRNRVRSLRANMPDEHLDESHQDARDEPRARTSQINTTVEPARCDHLAMGSHAPSCKTT
jgi:hypothetical protein